MQRQHAVPGLIRRLMSGRGFAYVNAGGMNEDGETAQFAYHLIGGTVGRLALRQICADDDDTLALAAQPPRGCLSLFHMARRTDPDMRSLGSKGRDDRRADTARSTRHVG